MAKNAPVALKMKKKEIILIVALVLVGWFYVKYFTDWFTKKQIGIVSSLRPAPGAPVLNVIFKLDGQYKLTKLKVAPYNENGVPESTPCWDLVADSNSFPTNLIIYGHPIKGLKPALAGTQPEPLNPDLIYHMEVAAGEVKGAVDFRTQPSPRRH